MERFHLTHARPVAETTERTLLDVVAAIRLVAAGGARRVVLSSLPDPDLVAAEALVHAQVAGVAFRLDRRAGERPTVIVGPRLVGEAGRPLPLHHEESPAAS